MPLRTITRILLLVLLPMTAWAALGERDSRSLDDSAPHFLPVHEAYQARASLEGSQLRVDWHIADGYYLYRHGFKSRLPLLLPTGLRTNDDLFGEVEVYYGAVSVLMDPPADADHAALAFQGCADAGLCYPPEVLHWQIDHANRTVVPVAAEPQPASPQPNDHSGLMLIALIAFIGGLILNLMPCVFPVLSLKVIAITTHAHRGSTLTHALCYAGGVIGSFLLMGGALILIRAGGSSAGWGFQLQSPQVITALIWLFTGITITLLGGFSPGLRWLGVGQHLTEGNRPTASFFTGALAVVVASPCTAPFMATALGYAMTQPAVVTLTVFACLGAGMAAPFVVLGLLPALARRLPKPGPWMEHFKHWLALPMAATIVWLLWVLSHQTSTTSLLLALAGSTALALACWLFERHREPSAPRNTAWLLLVLSVLPIAFISSSDARINPQADSWSAQKVIALRAQGQPVFVNVTADWCITCLANERLVLDTDATRALFARHRIHYLKADWTRPDPAINALLAEFGRSGVPLYVLYPADTRQQPVVFSQILTPSALQSTVEDTLPAQ
ncbi:MAG TPA: protein-disulfide reductase DsbD domain-containing protein [Pseudomonadales bacterium]